MQSLNDLAHMPAGLSSHAATFGPQRYLVVMPPLPKKKKRNYAQLTLRQGIFLWAKVDGVCNELRVPAIPPPQAPLMSE